MPENGSENPFSRALQKDERSRAMYSSAYVWAKVLYLCTANPEYYFNYTGILEDEWETESGIYVAPKAEITEDGKLVFTFCFDYSDYASDYTRVVATYTPNN